MSDSKKTTHSEHTASVQDDSHSASPLDLFSVDPGLILWTWITFGLLFLILKKYAWQPLKETVAKREKDIAESVENAAIIKKSLEELDGKQQKILKEAEKQKMTIIKEAREIAERTGRNIENKAKASAEKIVASARAEIESEREKAVSEIKREAVDIIIQTTSQLIEKNLDSATHRKLVKQYVEAL